MLSAKDLWPPRRNINNYPTFRESNRFFEEAFDASRSPGQNERGSGGFVLDAYTPRFCRADLHLGENGRTTSTTACTVPWVTESGYFIQYHSRSEAFKESLKKHA